MALDSYYDKTDAVRRRSCFHCKGKLFPTKEYNICNNILIQIYKCVDCGNNTNIPEKPPLQTSLDPNELPTIQEKYDHPEA